MDADLHQKVMLALLGKTATKGVDAAIRIVVEACASVADEHRARVKDHNPDKPGSDLVAQGYGNAALNIAAAIRGIVK